MDLETGIADRFRQSVGSNFFLSSSVLFPSKVLFTLPFPTIEYLLIWCKIVEKRVERCKRRWKKAKLLNFEITPDSAPSKSALPLLKNSTK